MNLLRPLLPLLLATLCAAQETFRIGTWNLEFLGAEGNYRNNLPPRTDADHAAIGRKVRELGVSVLAVQEINDAAALQKVAAGAGDSWQLVLGASGEWTDGKTAQRIGFLYDSKVVDLLFAEQLDHLPREFEGAPIFHRVPVTAGFRHRPTGADFRLVTVHLKAGQKPDDQKKRRGEAQALAGWLDELRRRPGEDPDIVLLGDFNSSYGAEPEQVLERSGLFTYVDQKKPTPTILHFAEPIDQVVVSTGCVELRRDSLSVGNDLRGLAKEAWRQTYSDHFPVTVVLAATGDDDPEATFHRDGRAVELVPGGGSRRAAAVAWPFEAGVAVHIKAGGEWYEGRLVASVPQDGGGWVLLATDDGLLAIACAQVAVLRVRS
ncbi:MAG: hypothetical protein KF830_13025 [Planctomycetes bacterium]|nr:hypothetical protein [Planctomycetota bacterium]